ncbi:MAG: Lrp/AsnC family transcriptional regulator [Alphaproteobacteria bacterium]|nr:Lrp/AsnC family transcriptional regulator [Alphaproteobacteria bacterium]
MNDVDRKIIGLLAEDARRALADIGGTVGLSASAVNERIRRLVAEGAIRGFTVDAAPEALGLPVLAFVFVALAQGSDEAGFRHFVAAQAAILECHHVTGGWSYLVKIRVADLGGVEAFLAALKHAGYVGRSETMIVLSSPVGDAFVPREAS